MFTGLIEEVGTVIRLVPGQDVSTLELRAPVIAPFLGKGQSVSVMGACLTVAGLGRDGFYAEMMEETVLRTKLGKLEPGDPVNLERALSLSGRLDGHLVTGHVDGTCYLVKSETRGRTRVFGFRTEPRLAEMIVPKGSVALDGVSLTVIESDPSRGFFSVGLIPETLRQTTLGGLSSNEPVNLETDLIAKYVRRFMAPGEKPGESAGPGITWDTLRQGGWV